MALLGDDGRGDELARRLESHGVWRSWLGDPLYANFVHFLSSSSSWEAFMRADDSKPRAQIHLQLRARALLFDKASVSLFLAPPPQSSSAAISNLNSNYLQLHGDDVYFTFEDCPQQREGVVATKTALLKGLLPRIIVMCLSNLGDLAELVKDSTRNSVQQTQQQLQFMQSQIKSQQQAAIRQPQQTQRQVQPQMQQMVHPQNLAFQEHQQWDRMRRRQPATPRPGMNMNMDNVRPFVEVEIENPSEFPINNTAFNTITARHPQLQFREQQIAAMSNFHPQSSN